MSGIKDNYISVVVATYNRCESLSKTLTSLVRQDNDVSFDYEVIVVDNNSNDRTQQLVQSFVPQFKGKLRYLFESRQGKSYALNAGIMTANGAVIAFTDDDCVVSQNWLQRIHTVLQQNDVDVLRGKVIPIFKNPLPAWLDLNINIFKGPLVYFDLGDNYLENKDLEILPSGANLVIRREVYDSFDGFRLENRSQDTELCHRWSRLGAKVGYSPQLIVQHMTPVSRLNKAYMRKWHFLSGKNSAQIFCEDYTQGRSLLGIPLWVYKRLIFSIGRYLKSCPFFQKNNFVNEIWIHYHLGVIWGLWGCETPFENLR